MKKVLITGGSGTLGTVLTKQLLAKGHSVSWYTRRVQPTDLDVDQYTWDPETNTADPAALKDADVIFHLAGASIAGKRWNQEYKKVLRDSRIKGTELLFNTCKKNDSFPSHFISSSAIGYYGYDAGSIVKSESSRFGDDFLATLTKDWEAAADLFSSKSTKVTKMRTGIVMSSSEGALEAMAKPIRLGFGAPLATGDQYVSWIHEDDVAGTFLFVMEKELEGPFNQVAPNPVTNEQLTKAIARKLRKPLFLPNVPSFMVRLLIGEMAASVVGGIKVSSAKLEEAGYEFKYTEINAALENLL